MSLSLKAAQAVNELASLLYDFLPNKPHPYADPSISLPGVAHDLGLAAYYTAGSKLTVTATLLTRTLEHQPGSFSALVTEIVKRGLIYRNSKKTTPSREEIEAINAAIAKAGFKIPELWDPAFLDTLPRKQRPAAPKRQVSRKVLDDLKTVLMGISDLGRYKRGPAFEQFLQALFSELNLAPRGSIKLVGEQIDGSFDLDSVTYLLEAKFHSEPVQPRDLRVFRDKVDTKASWSRGLFVSWSGFSPDAADALARGRSTNIVGMTGQDLLFVLDGSVTLQAAIRMKVRRAAETGEALVPLQQLLLEVAR